MGQRSAASIARRVQDPLAELVKIDPKSIGVGQYQHDMNQKKLGETLSGVVEDCVNKVGVDLNTASAPLLEYISGISKTIAKNIVAYREENGRFRRSKTAAEGSKAGTEGIMSSAQDLCGSRAATNPLGSAPVYIRRAIDAAENLLEKAGILDRRISQIGNWTVCQKKSETIKSWPESWKSERSRLRDIVKELEKPARDPRDEMPKPILRTDVLEMKDLTPGMILKGTVT